MGKVSDKSSYKNKQAAAKSSQFFTNRQAAQVVKKLKQK